MEKTSKNMNIVMAPDGYAKVVEITKKNKKKWSMKELRRVKGFVEDVLEKNTDDFVAEQMRKKTILYKERLEGFHARTETIIEINDKARISREKKNTKAVLNESIRSVFRHILVLIENVVDEGRKMGRAEIEDWVGKLDLSGLEEGQEILWLENVATEWLDQKGIGNWREYGIIDFLKKKFNDPSVQKKFIDLFGDNGMEDWVSGMLEKAHFESLAEISGHDLRSFMEMIFKENPQSGFDSESVSYMRFVEDDIDQVFPLFKYPVSAPTYPSPPELFNSTSDEDKTEYIKQIFSEHQAYRHALDILDEIRKRFGKFDEDTKKYNDEFHAYIENKLDYEKEFLREGHEFLIHIWNQTKISIFKWKKHREPLKRKHPKYRIPLRSEIKLPKKRKKINTVNISVEDEILFEDDSTQEAILLKTFVTNLKGVPAERFDICKNCGKAIVITRKGKEFCSQSCAVKAGQKKRRKENPEAVRRQDRKRYHEERKVKAKKSQK